MNFQNRYQFVFLYFWYTVLSVEAVVNVGLLWHVGTEAESWADASHVTEVSPTRSYPVSHWNVQTVL